MVGGFGVCLAGRFVPYFSSTLLLSKCRWNNNNTRAQGTAKPIKKPEIH